MNEPIINFVTALIQMSLITILYRSIDLYSKERHIISSAIFILSVSITICLFLQVIKLEGNNERYIAYLIIYLAAKFSFGKSFKETFFDIFTLFSILYFIQSIQVIILKILYPEYLIYLSIVSKLENMIIINISVFIFVFLCTRVKYVSKLINSYRIAIEYTPISTVYILFPILIIQKIGETIPDVSYKHLYLFLVFIWLFFLFNFILLNKSVEIIEQKKLIQTYRQYYPIISRMVNETKIKQHEFRNHLNVITAMVKDNKDIKIEQYIDEINNSSDLCFLLELENKVLAGLIYSKICEANERLIDFSCNISGVLILPLKDHQIVEVLGNLIDNAFEAVCLKDSNRIVVLQLGVENDNYYIRIKNNGPKLDPKSLQSIFECGYSTKGYERGYGLYNVRAIIRQIKGEIVVNYDNNYTVFEILLNNGGVGA